jgi:hypothetical protein
MERYTIDRAAPEVLVMGWAWPSAPGHAHAGHLVHGLLQQLQETERRRQVVLQLEVGDLGPGVGDRPDLAGTLLQVLRLGARDDGDWSGVVVEDVTDLSGLLVVFPVEGDEVLDVGSAPRRAGHPHVRAEGDGDQAERVGPLVNQLVIDVLPDDLVGDHLDVGVHRAGAVGGLAPELVLQLELDQPGTVVGVERREAVGRVDRQDADLGRVDDTH